NKLKFKKVAVFTNVKNDYSKSLAKNFKKKFLADGGEITVELDYSGGEKNFKKQITAIKASNPDAVMIPGYYTDIALICIQAKQLGLDVPMFGGDGWESSKLFEIGGKAVEGNYLSSHYHPDAGGELCRQFVENYRKHFGGETPD